MLKAALFDFDGTLVDTTELIYQSLRHASREVLGHEPSSEVLMANVGQPLQHQMSALVEKEADAGAKTDGLADELLESYFVKNEELHEDLIKEFPGVEGALDRLKKAGLRIAVVTSKRRRSVEKAVETYPGIGKVAEHFVTMEDTEEHKPKPAPLLKGLELLGGIPVEEAAYVGDSPHDIEAAHAAGVTSIGVSWGAFPEEAVRSSEPDYFVQDVDAAVDIILELAGY